MAAKYREALKEEWSVFKLLFSEELIQKVLDKNLPKDERRNILRSLNALGFSGICEEIIRNSHETQVNEMHEKGIPEIDIEKVQKICSLFINEIKSPNLKEVFISSVEIHLNHYEELNRCRIS